MHRVKIAVLQDMVQQHKGNILYCDTDIVFTRPIDKMLRDINEGRLYMHIMESIVSEERNPVLRKLNAHIKKDSTLQLGGKPLNEMAMWNAGVLGFNTQHAALLDEVLAFTDREYPKFPKHVVEQFAFSVYFQHTENVKAAAPYIFHYWNLKEAAEVLASFFGYFAKEEWSALVTYSSLVQMEALMQEKVNFLHNRGIGGILKGDKWQPAAQPWPLLRQQV